MLMTTPAPNDALAVDLARFRAMAPATPTLPPSPVPVSPPPSPPPSPVPVLVCPATAPLFFCFCSSVVFVLSIWLFTWSSDVCSLSPSSAAFPPDADALAVAPVRAYP